MFSFFNCFPTSSLLRWLISLVHSTTTTTAANRKGFFRQKLSNFLLLSPLQFRQMGFGRTWEFESHLSWKLIESLGWPQIEIPIFWNCVLHESAKEKDNNNSRKDISLQNCSFVVLLKIVFKMSSSSNVTHLVILALVFIVYTVSHGQSVVSRQSGAGITVVPTVTPPPISYSVNALTKKSN